MASAAEQLAANFNFANFGKAKELRQRILFTLAVLIVARLGTYIPMPGIDPSELCAPADQPAAGRRARHLQHAVGRRGAAHGDLRARHHALHLGLDHHSADDDGVSRAGSAEERRRGRAARPSTSTRATARSVSRRCRPTASPSAWSTGAMSCHRSRASSSASPR